MFMDLNFGVLDFDQKFKIFDFFFPTSISKFILTRQSMHKQFVIFKNLIWKKSGNFSCFSLLNTLREFMQDMLLTLKL